MKANTVSFFAVGCCVAALIGTVGLVGTVAAVPENNLKLIPSVAAIQGAALVVADNAASQGAAQQVEWVIGVCHLSANPFVPQTAANVLNPQREAYEYFRDNEHFVIEGEPVVSVVQTPAHGVLENEGEGYFSYYPKKGYLGSDRASLLVEVGGKKVKMEYFFRVVKSVPDLPNLGQYKDLCPNQVRVWKISSNTASGNNFISAIDHRQPAAN